MSSIFDDLAGEFGRGQRSSGGCARLFSSIEMIAVVWTKNPVTLEKIKIKSLIKKHL